MPFFNNAEQVYSTMQALFEHLRHETPNPVDTLVSSRLNILITLSDPEAHININGRKRPVEVKYGTTNGRADLEISMTADQLHQILLDEYSIKTGFANGELKVRGPVWKTLAFADIFIQGRTYYPEVLREQGLG
ncbi:MAG TPA: hypothetical protein DEH25_15275 [Chloroflexi bacterium]|nr:hypothetical protein [Chloroflexota bacterium]